MRSNTTMVSCTEKPITVKIAVKKSASASQPKSRLQMLKMPTVTRMSCTIAMIAETP